MHIIIAPDKFKGSLSAAEVGDAIRQGIHSHHTAIKTTILPLADGGDGAIEVLDHYRPLRTVEVAVQDALFRPVTATYKTDGHTAYIEMAAAAGLSMLAPGERNCLETTTYGVGRLVMDAIRKGAVHVLLFVGGSATNDGGIGLAAALGYRFLDENGRPLSPIGKHMERISRIDKRELHIAVPKIGLTVICDVNNPFYGPTGAAYIYARQKGASEADLPRLDTGLRHLASLIRRDLGKDISQIPGAGAAGGLAGGAIAFMNGAIRSGTDYFLEVAKLEDHLRGADLIVTGEGLLDGQTAYGKAIDGVSHLARKAKVPCVVICGDARLSEAEREKLGITRIYRVMSKAGDLDDAMKRAADYVAVLAEEMMVDFMGPSPRQ